MLFVTVSYHEKSLLPAKTNGKQFTGVLNAIRNKIVLRTVAMVNKQTPCRNLNLFR